MYSSSVTTGDFEPFIARDVVSYVDAHDRTIPIRNSRGLVGHSMGGYGASRIGMKHADVFGSLYIMSPCCLSPRGIGPANPATEEALAAVKTPADSAKRPFGLRAQLAAAAAWSPNPKNPPLFLDLPSGENQQSVLARWVANAPLAFVDQYVGNLRQYRGMSIDVGDKDGLRADASRLHDALTRTRSRMASKSIRARTRAPLRCAFRNTSYLSSAERCRSSSPGAETRPYRPRMRGLKVYGAGVPVISSKSVSASYSPHPVLGCAILHHPLPAAAAISAARHPDSTTDFFRRKTADAARLRPRPVLPRSLHTERENS